jgi:hypothetical protein
VFPVDNAGAVPEYTEAPLIYTIQLEELVYEITICDQAFNATPDAANVEFTRPTPPVKYTLA